MKLLGTIIVRILTFLPFAFISFIGAMVMWFKWIKNFILYGGEAIAYTDKQTRKTIYDTYNKLETILNDK